MKKNLLNELNEMKYLFGYRRGKILSEQNTPFMEEEFEDDAPFDTTPSPKAAPAAAPKKVDDVAAAFDDLFNS